MLAQLTISNFAIVRELEIDFHSGMTAITGETGAGKSIAIDALGLCLGGRAKHMVREAPAAQTCAPASPERYSGGAALAGREPAGKRT
jgi:DNA repair protein RecN (Recombination protein N)